METLKTSTPPKMSNIESCSTRSHGVINTQSSNHNGANGTKKSDGKSASSSSAVVCFFRRYCPPASADAGSILNNSRVRHLLGQKYHENITSACSQTPYCLYLYTGVDLEEQRNSNVIMVGFFNKASGENQIGLLDVFSSEETADAICTCIVEILRKYKIPLTNMAIIYSDFPHHEDLLSRLNVFKPEIVSLCGLTNLAGQVCHSGVIEMEVSGLILNLIKDIYKHFLTFPVALKEMLIDVDLDQILTSQCSLFWRIIDRITTAWSDLEKHFSRNTTILSDAKLRLNVLFLCHALQPLHNFEEKIYQGVSVTHLLQDASQLLTFYTSSFLRSKAAESFLRRGKISLLKDTAGHLPRGQVKVGKAADDFLQQNSEELTDYLESFHKSVISFYTTVTRRIVECLPLPDSTIRKLPLVLSPVRKLEVTGRMVQELGLCFAVCSSLLMDEFLEYQFIDESDMPADEGSMQQYWKKELRIMGRSSFFGKLILSLLALPGTLKKEIIFEQMFHHTEEKNMADDNVTDSSSYKSAPSHISLENADSITSGVADLMEVEDIVSVSSESNSESQMDTQGESDNDCIIDDDCTSSDDDVCWINRKKRKIHFEERHNKQERAKTYQGGYAVGEIVWGPIEGFGLWPGLVQSCDSGKPCDSMRKVMFFGNGMVLEVSVGDLLPFFSFAQCFCSNSFKTVTTYKDAIFSSLQVASKRSRMYFSPDTDCKDELIRVMLNWAFGGFKPSGVNGLRPQSDYNEKDDMPQPVNGKASSPNRSARPEKLFNLTVSLNKLSESLDLSKGSIDLMEKDVFRELMCPEDNCRLFKTIKNRWDFKYLRRNKHTVMPSMQEVGYMEEVRPRQNGQKRYAMVHKVLVNKRKIEEFCLSCGSTSVEILHPLFEGSLCMTCRYNFTETLYRYDDDGYQAYCTICCTGMEVILCGLNSCCRCYCMECLDILVGVGTFKKLKEMDPWICYLCAPENSSGAMRPRHDWSIRVQEFFANTSGVDFEFQRVYPAIPANQRRPIRVLSLFDGIATGCLVLKELGFKVEKYVASEVDEESVVISMVNHDGTITHVDDVKSITKDHIRKWGPFDLLIGGSPCNDLCTVNPSRKGLYDGSGRLFFEYYRLLNILRPKEDDPRPFFWLFENVVLMETKTKTDISRFLECNPVLIDAVKVSPAHRARYFWGNIPGMNRPIVPSKNDNVNLQDCLDPGRTAKHDKVRTITTRPKAMGSGASYTDCPVTMNGKDDNIWITEMEQIFGFPKHYTDVRSMGRLQRQRVLGKSWSVPVIKHLLAPLKDYFACD